MQNTHFTKLNQFYQHMEDSSNYLPIEQLKDGHCYTLYARNAFVGAWQASKCGFVIARFGSTANPGLDFEYHWDFVEDDEDDPLFFGTAKPLQIIQAPAVQLKDTGKTPYSPDQKTTLLQTLLQLEEQNPVVAGINTVALNRQAAIAWGQRLAGKSRTTPAS